jgi:PEP-CTERM motif
MRQQHRVFRSALALAAFTLTSTLACSQAFADRLFATSGAGTSPSVLYELNPANGSVISTIGPVGFDEVVSIDFDPISGTLYGIANLTKQLITIDITTGAGQAVAFLNPGDFKSPDMTFDSAGTLYTWNEPNSDELNTVNLVTGAVAQVGFNTLVNSTARTGLDADSTDTIYLKDGSDGSIYTINSITGAETFVTNIGGDFDNALAFDSSDNLFTIDRTGGASFLYSINLSNGATTNLGSTGIPLLAALAFQVPEPTSVTLLGFGIVGLLNYAWRARKRRAIAAT